MAGNRTFMCESRRLFCLLHTISGVLAANDADAEETLELYAANDITRPFAICTL
jgi:hypothetical protein